MNMLLETRGGHERRWKRYPAYKDSGVEWVGEVPEHWGLKRLKYISTVNDETLSETTDSDFELLYVDISSVDPVLGIKNKELMTFGIAPSRARRKVCHGDVILSTVRTYLRAISPINDPEPNMIVSTGFAVIRPKDGLESRFAAYALCAPYFVDEVVANSVGVSYPAINANELITFNVALPSLPEQRAIAAFLDHETGRIDALIAKKERQIELLREKRTALISHAVTKGLDPDAPMKDSGVEWLGEVPEDWEVNRIATVFRQRDERGRDDLPVLSVSLNTGVEERDFSNDRIQPKMSDYSQYKITYSGDIVFNKMRMWQGAVGVAPCDGFVSPDYTVAVPFQDVCSKFYEYLFRTRAFTAEVMRYSHGIALDRNRLYWDGFKQIKVPVMTFSEQNEISSYLGRTIGGTDMLSSKVSESITKLREYRTALISAAVTGKIDVRGEET